MAGGGTPISSCTAVVPSNPALNGPPPADDIAISNPNAGSERMGEVLEGYSSTNAMAQAKAQVAQDSASRTAAKRVSSKADNSSSVAAAVPSNKNNRNVVLSHHAVRNNSRPSSDSPDAPLVDVTVALGTLPALPAGKTATIKYAVTVNTPPLVRQISAQGTVTYNGNPGGSGNTTDFSPPNGPNTVTLIDTLMTWNGVTSTDWNTITNWTQPAGGTQYAPGVSNPAVNDVVIPNVGQQPAITATDIGIYSLNIANGRTLTIQGAPLRTLTIGGTPGGNLTLDGIISGGQLNLGTGAHAISNAGGTGSLSATNLATVLSGSTVTLNNNLQAGALTVDAGGSMDITGRTLSLNGIGGLAVPRGATLTTTGSTVVFNGTAAQQAAGIAYNNLTINNTAAVAPNALGATLTGNATVNGTLALTSNDLNTSTFTLTQPNTTASTGAGDVVGTVTRTAPFGTTTITFGNPNNQITFTAAGTKPSTMTVTMAKAAPATYAAAVQRNYIITPTGGSGYTVTLRLHYLDTELNLNSETPDVNFNLRQGPDWKAVVPTSRNTAGTTDGWLENNAVTSFSQWTFANLAPTAANGTVTGRIVDNNGLPVEGAVIGLGGTQNRKFITDTNGFYRFDNVETNGFYIVTPSRVNYSFSPSSRAFSQLGSNTEATFSAAFTGPTANPLDTPEYFVRQHYLDFLGREPDEGGFNYWSDQILVCTAADSADYRFDKPSDRNHSDQSVTDCIQSRRVGVSAAFFFSIEFQQTGGFVDRLYRASYDRRPQYGEFMSDVKTMNGTVVGQGDWGNELDAKKAAFISAWVQRPAFRAAYDNLADDGYVDRVLSNTGVELHECRT